MNANDKAMLEKVKPGWWIKSREAEKGPGGRSDDGWCLVVHSGQPSGPHVWRHRSSRMHQEPWSNITALHAPTDNPQMVTTYKIGESEEVTREEAEKMVKSNWYWLLPDDQQIRHAIDVLPLEIIIGMVEAAYAIESPGGNVYRIKEG